MASAIRISRAAAFGYLAALALLVAACLWLNFDVYRLRQHLTTLRREAQTPVGAILPPLTGYDLAGKPVLQPGPGEPYNRTLLFVASPSCSICKRNWPYWKDIIQHTPRSAKIVLVDLFDQMSPEYVRGVPFSERNIIRRLSGSTILAYRFSGVPQTVLLDEHNRVISSVEGVLTSDQVKELMRRAQE